MTRIDEIISNALAGIEETEVAILARELLKTREALALAQQAKGDAEGRAALMAREVAKLKQVPAVVVPELPTWEDGENKLRRGEKLTALEKFVMDHDWHKTDTTFRDGLEAVFAELRAIPADRVLGDGMVAARWIPVSESLPEDGESVGFVINSTHDEWNHGRAVGGRFNRKHFDKGFGGFSFPGIEWAASHWCKLPPIHDALRANQGGADHA